MDSSSTINYVVYIKAVASSACCALLLSACNQVVDCKINSQEGRPKWVAMLEGECKKIADTQIKAISKSASKAYKKYPYDSYVQCYGIAAAHMNDCGTKTTACGGSVATAKDPAAWIALPKGICQQLDGAKVVEETKKS